MPDTPSPAPSSPASLVDVAAARDALTWAIGALDALALAYIPEKRREASTMLPRLVALREALLTPVGTEPPTTLADIIAGNAWLTTQLAATERRASEVSRLSRDAAIALADADQFVCMAHPHESRISEALCSAKYQLAAAERRASEAEARATRAEREIAETLIVVEGVRIIAQGFEEAHEALSEMTTERDDLTARLADSERALAEARDAQRFAGRVMASWREDGPADLDGGDVQEWLIEAGLADLVEMGAPCAVECMCREFGFPTKCLRWTDAGNAAIRSAAVSRGPAPTTPTTETRDG
jgi:hypothetical protein